MKNLKIVIEISRIIQVDNAVCRKYKDYELLSMVITAAMFQQVIKGTKSAWNETEFYDDTIY